MVDLSGYEGVRAVKAVATDANMDRDCVILLNADGDGNPHCVAYGDGRMTWCSNDGRCSSGGMSITSVIGELTLPEPPATTPQLGDRVTLDGQEYVVCPPADDHASMQYTMIAMLIRELADSHKKLIEVVGKKFENYGA